MWNNTYKKLYKRANSLINKDMSIVFYSEKEQPYLETGANGVGLRASLLQVREGMQFPKDEASNNMALANRYFK